MPKKTLKNNITNFYNGKLFIQYASTDFQKTKAFYHNGLGLDLTDFSQESNPEEVGIIEFDLPAKGAILSLSKATPEKFQASDSLVIMVTEIDKLKESLASKKIETSKIIDDPGLLSFMTVKDPDKNAIMFMSEPRIKS